MSVSNLHQQQIMIALGTLFATLKCVLVNPNDDGLGAPLGDYFGYNVSVSSMYSIFGVYGEDAGFNNVGIAYIFDNSTCSLLHTLHNPNSSGTPNGDQFGRSVSITDDYAIVGAYNEDEFGENNAGKAYIYDPESGNLLRTLDNPNDFGTGVSDLFGISVSISGNYCIVGAYEDDAFEGDNSGRAYIFDVPTGTLLHTLYNPDEIVGVQDDLFGGSDAISGNYCIVGAYRDGSDNIGSAYIFNVTTGALLHTLDNPNIDGVGTDDEFGRNLAISPEYSVVGVDSETVGGIIYSGRVYIFDNITGDLFRTIEDPNGYGTNNFDLFGGSVTISGNYCVVGAPGEDDVYGQNSGTVYMFDVTTGDLVWQFDNPNTGGSGTDDDNFGRSVGLWGKYGVIGASGETPGMSYTYDLLTDDVVVTPIDPIPLPPVDPVDPIIPFGFAQAFYNDTPDSLGRYNTEDLVLFGTTPLTGLELISHLVRLDDGHYITGRRSSPYLSKWDTDGNLITQLASTNVYGLTSNGTSLFKVSYTTGYVLQELSTSTLGIIRTIPITGIGDIGFIYATPTHVWVVDQSSNCLLTSVEISSGTQGSITNIRNLIPISPLPSFYYASNLAVSDDNKIAVIPSYQKLAIVNLDTGLLVRYTDSSGINIEGYQGSLVCAMRDYDFITNGSDALKFASMNVETDQSLTVTSSFFSGTGYSSSYKPLTIIPYDETVFNLDWLTLGTNRALIGTSDNGINWREDQEGNTTGSSTPRFLMRHKGVWLRADDSGVTSVQTSEDGYNWTNVDSPASCSEMASDGDILVMAEGRGSGDGEIWWSDDLAQTWNLSRTTPEGAFQVAYASGSGLWMVCSYKGKIYTSSDGKTFNFVSDSFVNSSNFQMDTDGTNFLVIARFTGDVYTSTNGTGWTQLSDIPTGRVGTLAWAGSHWFAADDSNDQMLRSTDGSSWTTHALPGAPALASSYSQVKYANGVHVVIGYDNSPETSIVWYSTDGGSTWLTGLEIDSTITVVESVTNSD